MHVLRPTARPLLSGLWGQMLPVQPWVPVRELQQEPVPLRERGLEPL